MSNIRLGVNIDHVATVRNARGEIYPSPLRAALIAQKNGADSITIHLREDRRHIKELDLKEIKLKFSSQDKAIEYAEANNIEYKVFEPKQKKFVIKSYEENFTKN